MAKIPVLKFPGSAITLTIFNSIICKMHMNCIVE